MGSSSSRAILLVKERLAKERSDIIDQELEEDGKGFEGKVKILLLGG